MSFKEWMLDKGYTREGIGVTTGPWMSNGEIVSGRDLVTELENWKKEFESEEN